MKRVLILGEIMAATTRRTLFVLSITIILVIIYSCKTVECNDDSPAKTRSAKRLHIPFLGIGPRCTGCPEHFCDDDPAIVHGYCCGCAKFFDNIPVKCAPHLECPLNTYDLCESYEYMMHCCCDD